MILADTDEAADAALERRKANSHAPFPINAGLRQALIEQDKRNVGGQARPANVGGVLPISFCGGPDRVIKQIKQAREEIGVGVLDLSLADPGSGDNDAMMASIDLFGKQVLPHIREI
jgi:alkanesulfonate monooxygenase SsuD/methylene tetrahydromethanopterin reductase-like flavin-dependent oxidoreductase (luciferase family)